jgi:cytochrome c oxidase accessory protein FixG
MAQKIRKPNLDTVTTINRDGSRSVLHPSDVSGRYTLRRRFVAYALIALFIALPWIPVNGYPAVFLDLAERRFHLFGITLAAQELWLLFFMLTGMAFLLFYLTALFGRVWCGWACPQTVYLEHVYRRIERWIEGDGPRRRRLDAAPWSPEKVAKRLLKHGAFLIVSVVVVHIFLSYFVSLPRLWEMMTQNPGDNLRAFLFVFIATGLVYANFAWFREQLCIVICPYGRLQSALIDNHSINVGYDERRGEPRGRPGVEGNGDCIDCHRCVQVCPTGIDIRQGMQLECVGCTACIDACDAVMERLKRPRGLIRYDSMEGFEGRKTRFVRPRTLLYTALLFIGAGVSLWAFSGLQPADAALTRMPGLPSYVTEEAVRNQFYLRVVNKSTEPMTFSLEVEAPVEGLSVRGFDADSPALAAQAEERRTLILVQERAAYTGPFDFKLLLKAEPGGHLIERQGRFLGPDPRVFEKKVEKP